MKTTKRQHMRALKAAYLRGRLTSLRRRQAKDAKSPCALRKNYGEQTRCSNELTRLLWQEM